MQNYSGEEGLQYHLQVGKGDMGRYVIIPGGPERCEKIAKHFDSAWLVASSRKYITYTDCLDREEVSVISTGIGSLSAPIALEELVPYDADTFIRVGTCDGMEMNVRGGDIIVATGATRIEGASKEYAPTEYPAMADLDVANALVSAAEVLGHAYYAGVVEYKDVFYGQYGPERMSASYELLNKWEAWKRMGYKASGMESAALFITANHLRVRCDSDFLVMGNQERQNAGLDNPIVHNIETAIKTAVEAIRRLIKKDRS